MGRKKKSEYQYYQIITENGLETVKPNHKVTRKRKEKGYRDPREKHVYEFDGCVKEYGRIAIGQFHATTTAVSEKQANNNIIYQAKKKLGKVPQAGGFFLVGELKQIDVEEEE